MSATLRILEFGGLMRVRDNFSSHGTGFDSQNRYIAPIRIPEKSDFKFRADVVSANNTVVSCRFDLLIVNN